VTSVEHQKTAQEDGIGCASKFWGKFIATGQVVLDFGWAGPIGRAWTPPQPCLAMTPAGTGATSRPSARTEHAILGTDTHTSYHQNQQAKGITYRRDRKLFIPPNPTPAKPSVHARGCETKE
jgi:hypothetical protein